MVHHHVPAFRQEVLHPSAQRNATYQEVDHVSGQHPAGRCGILQVRLQAGRGSEPMIDERCQERYY